MTKKELLGQVEALYSEPFQRLLEQQGQLATEATKMGLYEVSNLLEAGKWHTAINEIRRALL